MRKPLDTNSKTVMIVDDDADMNMLLTLVLENDGLKVISVKDGRTALDLLAGGAAPDLIFTDMCMPLMSGAELIYRLKDNPKTAAVPVIIASGLDDIKKTSVRMGAQNHLVKPFPMADFQATVKHYVNPIA